MMHLAVHRKHSLGLAPQPTWKKEQLSRQRAPKYQHLPCLHSASCACIAVHVTLRLPCSQYNDVANDAQLGTSIFHSCGGASDETPPTVCIYRCLSPWSPDPDQRPCSRNRRTKNNATVAGKSHVLRHLSVLATPAVCRSVLSADDRPERVTRKRCSLARPHRHFSISRVRAQGHGIPVVCAPVTHEVPVIQQ